MASIALYKAAKQHLPSMLSWHATVEVSSPLSSSAERSCTWTIALVNGTLESPLPAAKSNARCRPLLAVHRPRHPTPSSSLDLSATIKEAEDEYDTPSSFARVHNDADATFERLRPWLGPFWVGHLLSFWPLRPAAAQLLHKLDTSNSLGHPKTSKGKDTLFDFMRNQKDNHPDKVLLVKVGDSYEAWGLDAILLVQHCGLNPMAGSTRASCPSANIQQTVDCLVDAGLMVAVFEEGPSMEKNALKSRFLGGILSPGSSTYIYNARLRMDDIQYREGRAYIGVQISAGGASAASLQASSLQYTVYEVYVDAKCVHVSEKLTKEAAQCFIQRSHQSTGSIALFWARTGGGELSVHIKRFLGLSESLGRSVHLKNADFKPTTFLSEMLRHLATELERPELRKEDAMTKVKRDSSHQPRPLYMPTAQQLGLIPSVQVPNLVVHLLPVQAPAHVRRFFHNWLLQPPPYAIADAMQALLRALRTLTAALPPLDHRLSPSKLGALLGTSQANASMFRELYDVVKTATRILDPTGPFRKGDPCVTDPLLAIVFYESAIEEAQDAHCLLQRCVQVMDMIKEVVPLDLQAARTKLNLPENCTYKKALEEMVQTNEEQFITAVSWKAFAIKAKANKVKSPYTKLDAARQNFMDALENSFGAINEKDIKYSPLNNHIIVSSSKAPPHLAQWTRAMDKNFKELKNCWTTSEVEKQRVAYLLACQEAAFLAQKELEALSKALSQPDVFPAAKAAVYLKDILLAAYMHLQESIRRGWVLPVLESLHDMGRIDYEPINVRLTQVWPYWLRKEEAVKNDVHLKGQWLLTGPNMSGKSTLLRSVTAAALLANSGLAAPVSAKSLIPRLDGYFLRTNTTDCPTEGMSSFALELEDMRLLLRDATHRSLAAVDEFGRGTAPAEGAALAGHLLEELDGRKCPSIFATHLHFELLQLPIDLPRTFPKRLRVDLEGPGSFFKTGEAVRWTYSLEDGVCSDSLALATARRQEVPDAAVFRAQQLLAIVMERRGVARATLAVPVEYPHLQCASDDAVAFDLNPPKTLAAIEEEDVEGLEAESNDADKYTITDTSDQLKEPLQSKFDMAVAIARETCGADIEEGSECHLLPGDMPPVNLTNRACLYLLLLPGGNIYVGQSDAVSRRIQTHRQRKSAHLEAAIFVVIGGKSVARRLEAQVIRALQKSGLSPINSHDAANYNFATL